MGAAVYTGRLLVARVCPARGLSGLESQSGEPLSGVLTAIPVLSSPGAETAPGAVSKSCGVNNHAYGSDPRADAARGEENALTSRAERAQKWTGAERVLTVYVFGKVCELVVPPRE